MHKDPQGLLVDRLGLGDKCAPGKCGRSKSHEQPEGSKNPWLSLLMKEMHITGRTGLLVGLLICGAVSSGLKGDTVHSNLSSGIIRWSQAKVPVNGFTANACLTGLSNDVLIVAGGGKKSVAFPWSGNFHASTDVFIVQRIEDGHYQCSVGESLEYPLAYGCSVSFDGGVIVIGGSDGKRCHSDVLMLTWDPDKQVLMTKSLPPLPRPKAFMAATLVDHVVYVAGGLTTLNQPRATGDLWALDLTRLHTADCHWYELPSWPGSERIMPVAITQDSGHGDRLYLFGGCQIGFDAKGQSTVTALKDAYSFDPVGRKWAKRGDAPSSILSRPAAVVGQSHVFLFGSSDEDHSGRVLDEGPCSLTQDVLVYHTITDTWRSGGTMPFRATSSQAVPWKNKFIVLACAPSSGEWAAAIWEGRVPQGTGRFGTANYVVLASYLSILAIMGFYFARRTKSTTDFFLGGRRIPWWAAGLSIFGTQLSAITFMATPAKVYASDWHYFLTIMFILPVATPIVVFIFIPFYRRLNVTTAYEYLERRFNLTVRQFASLVYVLLQVGRMAIVVFLPALTLSAVTGINIQLCILIMGILCVLYTMMGGIAAVIWTDVLQVVTLLGAAIFCFVLIVSHLDGGFHEFISVGRADAKFALAYLEWDFTKASLIVVLSTAIFAAAPYISDQTVIQRYLTTKNEKLAARSMWLNGILCVPATILFFAVGTALYVYYKSYPGQLDPQMSNDSVFPWFIVQTLPPGVSGLAIAGVFAAAMSSLDSSINSSVTAIITDFIQRFKPTLSDRFYLKLARILTVVLGLAGTGVALLMAGQDIKSLWDQFTKIMQLLFGGLAGLFILGALTHRAHGTGVLVGSIGTALVLYYVQSYTPLHFFLYGAIGIVSSVTLGYLVSLLIPHDRGDLTGLTIYSLFTRKIS